MNLKGNITVSRAASNQEPDYIRVAIQDEQSGVQFVTVKIDLVGFAQAITGVSAIPCELDVRGLENVGKRRERKTELLPRSRDYYGENGETRAQEAVKPYEVDGWIGDWRDFFNARHWTKDEKCSVGFTRFVDIKED